MPNAPSDLRGLPLAKAVWADIRAGLLPYDQGRYRSRCGSKGCYAGNIGLYVGGQWASHDPDSPHFDEFIPPGGTFTDSMFAGEFAADALRLPWGIAYDALFAADLSPEEIDYALERWEATGSPVDDPQNYDDD